ncbi:MAG: two-component system, NtrC family, sensor kinase [Candidatus Sumerlaeota bacterium]|nr:two-component system, NtrC family, sensor kinase [Candidatus Sumerlaeota bacterium]
MVASKPKIILRSAIPGLQPEYTLGDTTTVGRHPSNNIILGADSISRFHARIDKRGNFFILQDLNSSNGTYVNGERITQMTLHHNDEVTFGAVEFAFHNETASGRISSGFEVGGMSIVEFKDDDAEESKPSTQSVISSAQMVEIRDRSSFITTPITAKQARALDPKDLAKSHNRLTAMFKLSELLRESEGDKEKSIIERALDILFEAVDADRGVILTRFADSTELEITAIRTHDELIPGTKISMSRTILDQVVRDRVAVLSADTTSDDRFDSSESIIMNRIHSVICVPMIHGERVMGVVHLDTQSIGKSLAKDDLEFVTMIAGDLSLALENIRMRREAAHRERLAAVGETVAGISHNIKNILLLMGGGSELLDRALAKGKLETAQDSWGVVSRGIEKISKLVKDMLEYSNQRRPRLVEIDVNALICSTAEEIEEQLVKKGITLELDLEEDIAPRWTDEMGLQRTLANLIVNAIEAIPHTQGHIEIVTAVLDDPLETLVIRIADNGSGIPQEKLDKVFLPFFTTKGSSGTGLGLPMCRKCIEDVRGTLTVESETNVGTTFIIKLPKLQDDDDLVTGGPGNTTASTDV